MRAPYTSDSVGVKPNGVRSTRLMSSSRYYYSMRVWASPAAASPDFQRDRHEFGNQAQPQRHVGLPLGGAFPWPLQREVVRRKGARRFGQCAQVLGTPDPRVVAFAVEPGEHAGRAWDLADEAKPGHQLEPV